MAAGRSAALAALVLLSGCATFAPRSRTPGPDARVVPGVPLARFEDDRCGAGSLSLVLGAWGDAVSPAELAQTLPPAPGGGVLSVDLLIAARRRGFDAALVEGDARLLRGELASGRPAILMLRLLDAPGTRRDIYHYVVADGVDPGRGLVRFQFGDGKARWARVESLERSWKASGHALLLVRARSDTDRTLARAIALERDGQPAAAAELYRDVLRVRPESVRAWVDLGNAAADLNQSSEAETAYRRALALAPDDRDALNNLAWLLLEAGDRLEEAETLASRAANQPGSDQPAALDTLGRIQLARGRCEQAEATFREALAGEVVDATTRDGLRKGLVQAGECRLPQARP